jgi:hypothetical protein
MSTGNDPKRYEYLAVRELMQLADELQSYSHFPPLFSTGKGQYNGHILGFVKGLRISAKLIYFLRKCLSTEKCNVSWGHVIDQETGDCSPECDVIIHDHGHFDRWNGDEHPIMEFMFVESSAVKAVISCKSEMTNIDLEYPKLMEELGVNKVFLFAERCSLTNYGVLREKALEAGYSGLWCSYFTEGTTPDEYSVDPEHFMDLRETLRKLFDA